MSSSSLSLSLSLSLLQTSVLSISRTFCKLHLYILTLLLRAITRKQLKQLQFGPHQHPAQHPCLCQTEPGLVHTGWRPGSPFGTSECSRDCWRCTVRRSTEQCPRLLLPTGRRWTKKTQLCTDSGRTVLSVHIHLILSGYESICLPARASICIHLDVCSSIFLPPISPAPSLCVCLSIRKPVYISGLSVLSV